MLGGQAQDDAIGELQALLLPLIVQGAHQLQRPSLHDQLVVEGGVDGDADAAVVRHDPPFEHHPLGALHLVGT